MDGVYLSELANANMNFVETQGIIFKVIKYSETSIICDIYTREKGLMSCIVSGVRSSKSGQKAAIYKPVNLVRVVAYDHNHEKLNRIKDISSTFHYQKINWNVLHSSVAIFILEICRNAIREREANYPLYDFIENYFKKLDESNHLNPNIHLVFMAQLSLFLGFAPMDNYSDDAPCFNMREGIFEPKDEPLPFMLDPDNSRIFNEICRNAIEGASTLQLNRQQRNQFTEIWLQYFKYHIPDFKDLNSYEILKMLF